MPFDVKNLTAVGVVESPNIKYFLSSYRIVSQRNFFTMGRVLLFCDIFVQYAQNNYRHGATTSILVKMLCTFANIWSFCWPGLSLAHNDFVVHVSKNCIMTGLSSNLHVGKIYACLKEIVLVDKTLLCK